MQRPDYPTLVALGFKDDEIKELGLWELATGDPAKLAEAYIRRSKKKDTLSVLRQHLREIVRAARSEGIQIRHVWFEQRSASKAHIRREEFEKATSAVLSALSRTLYVWRTDRLSRRGMGAVDRLIDELSPRCGRIVVTSEGLDSSLPGMRLIFGILADRAREEAKTISDRTKIGGDAHKRDGRWPGGVVPFGLVCPPGSGKLEHEPREYPTARRIADLLLAGTVPSEIANTLNTERIPTRKGKRWRAQTVIALAHSPSWAGLIPDRERLRDKEGALLDKWYRGGDPLLDAKGIPVSCGAGVVSYAEWLRIGLIISGRSKPGTAIGDKTRGVRKAATVLTGILRCPHCGGTMGNGGRSYRCSDRLTSGKAVCRGAATLRENADSAIAILWRNHILALPDESETLLNIARRWLAFENPETEARKREVTTRLDKAVEREAKLRKEFFVLQQMSEADYDETRAAVAEQVKAFKRELAELSQGADLSPLRNAEMLAALWDAEGIDGRRALLRAALKTVRLAPAACIGDKTPIIERLHPEWLDAPVSNHDEVIDGFMRHVELSRQRRKVAESTDS